MWKKIIGLSLISFLIFSIVFLIFIIPPVHASSHIVQRVKSVHGAPTNTVNASFSRFVPNDILIVIGSGVQNGELNTPTDNYSDIYTPIILHKQYSGGAGSTDRTYSWYTVPTTAHGIRVIMTSQNNTSFLVLYLFQVDGGNKSGIVSAFGGSPSGVACTAKTLCVNSSYGTGINGTVIAFWEGTGAPSTSVAGTGYTNIFPNGLGASEEGYFNSASGTNSTFILSPTLPTSYSEISIKIPDGAQISILQTITVTVFSTTTIAPNMANCNDTNSCVTNQTSSFFIILLPSIIIIALMEYFPYKMGIRDERVFIFVFMMAVSAIGFLSSLGAFGNNGIPFYIPIFCDIVGFMLIISFKGNGNTM